MRHGFLGCWINAKNPTKLRDFKDISQIGIEMGQIHSTIPFRGPLASTQKRRQATTAEEAKPVALNDDVLVSGLDVVTDAIKKVSSITF